MAYLIVMAVILFVPTAAVFGAWSLVDWFRDVRKVETKERNRRDRDAHYARVLRG